MTRWERWLLARVNRTVRDLSTENRRLREYQTEASETIRAIYDAEQRWKAEAQRWKAQAAHPSRGLSAADVEALVDQLVQIRGLGEVDK